MTAPTVLLACSGLGHVHRGFETFTRECHAALRRRSDVRVVLAHAPMLRRDRLPARAAGRAVRRDPYVVEQVSFAAALVPLVARVRPDVVFFCDWTFGRALARMPRRGFRMLLHNGAGGWPPFGAHVDHVQHPTPALRDVALRGGEPEARHTVIPIGLDVEPLQRPQGAQRRALRAHLGLPEDGRIVLSVAALNAWSKRLDYVIDEVASRPARRPHLVLLGHPEAQTPALRRRATERLGADGFTMRTVPSERVADHYRAADVFVLASTTEGFGRVILEALAHGLPVVAHDSPGVRWVAGGHATLDDLRAPGALARHLDAHDGDPAARHAYVREHFAWSTLAPRYAELLVRCAAR